MAHFSLSWDAYRQNICTGLSALQQNGEFVDMTLAADGHHVKVHQMIMSLVSPYIKELISSAQCPHPVIFLNKISYTTLCAILEYIYTGEVLVAKDNLSALIDAAKELHIKGLEDMKFEIATREQLSQSHSALIHQNEGQALTDTVFFSKRSNDDAKSPVKVTAGNNDLSKIMGEQDTIILDNSFSKLDDTSDHQTYDYEMETEAESRNTSTEVEKLSTSSTKKQIETQIQFTISNQGALQMILNRFMYYLRYTSRKGGASGHRQWRCVNYTRRDRRDVNCPATVITQDEVVVKRYGAHNHPFHDNKILKKVRDNAVFTAIRDAEEIGHKKKQERGRPATSQHKHDDTTDAE